MILKISYKPEDVVHQGKGEVFIKCRYYGQYSSAAFLCTTQGDSKRDFDDATKAKSGKTVFVGQRGGLSFE